VFACWAGLDAVGRWAVMRECKKERATVGQRRGYSGFNLQQSLPPALLIALDEDDPTSTRPCTKSAKKCQKVPKVPKVPGSFLD
jgi:hypothetical protein